MNEGMATISINNLATIGYDFALENKTRQPYMDELNVYLSLTAPGPYTLKPWPLQLYVLYSSRTATCVRTYITIML